MSHHRIEICDLHFSYPDGQKAISGIDLHITHGQSVGIIGANGAGKSTLLLLMMGVIFPSSGEIIIGDVKLTKKTLSIVRQRMGMVFQNPDDQLFMPTIYDDVAFGPRNHLMDELTVHELSMDALAKVGGAHLSTRAPYKLSGGEKRSCAIATVLSMQPDILIMDEPTLALDPQSRRRIMGILDGFSHTKIITSHDLDMVYDLCERVVIMKDGKIVGDGPADEILQNAPLLEKCGLEMPLRFQHCPHCGKRE